MKKSKTGSFRVLFPFLYSSNSNRVEEFIISLRARLHRHGAAVEIEKWRWSNDWSRGLSVFFPREHYTLIKSLLTLMFQSEELHSCVIGNAVAMRWVCGVPVIMTHNPQDQIDVLQHVKTGAYHRLKNSDRRRAEELWEKAGPTDEVKALLGA